MNRIKKYFFILFFLFLLLTFLSIFFYSNENKTFTKEKYTLGYCPTMESYAQEIKNKNSNLNLVMFKNSSDAIDNLNNNNVDFIIIGRAAQEKELLSPSFKKLINEKRYTFVSKNKSFISIEDLSSLKIHTYLEEITVSKILSDGYINIIFHDSLNSSIKEGFNEVILIDWDDYNDFLQLVVVMENNQKVEKYRLPLLYSIKQDIDIINI